MHPDTIRNRLHFVEYKGMVAVKKSWLSAKNIKRRLKWARDHVNWTIKQSKSVLWSDETKIVLFGSDGIVGKWRRPNERLNKECLRPTVKHGGGELNIKESVLAYFSLNTILFLGSLMIWGSMSWSGVGDIEFIDGIMNKEVYQGILERKLSSSVRKSGLQRRFIFQKDGDPKHTAKTVTAWLKKKKIFGFS